MIDGRSNKITSREATIARDGDELASVVLVVRGGDAADAIKARGRAVAEDIVNAHAQLKDGVRVLLGFEATGDRKPYEENATKEDENRLHELEGMK